MGLLIGRFVLRGWCMIGNKYLSEMLGLLYSLRVNRNQADRLCWTPTRTGLFEFQSYYKVLSSSPSQVFPWKSIWKVKVHPRVAFFVWMAAHGRIQIMDNLRKHIFVLWSGVLSTNLVGNLQTICFFIVTLHKVYGL
jgi:hypothetical protein